MSDILIRGMEMPVFEHQSWDIRRGADGKWYMVDTNAETSDGEWHEIVPVPPHGDLIDRDELMKHKGNCYDADGHLLYAVGTGSIMCAPTIIPAEENNNNR